MNLFNIFINWSWKRSLGLKEPSKEDVAKWCHDNYLDLPELPLRNARVLKQGPRKGQLVGEVNDIYDALAIATFSRIKHV